MQTNTQRIADGMVVSVAYTLTVEGEEVTQMTAQEPLQYLHGAENIVPGLENALTGKKVGDKLSLTILPEEGYGDYDDENIDEITRDSIGAIEDIEVGMDVEVEDEDGFAYIAQVREITGDNIVLDFNHPLAGKTLGYEVEIIDLRLATEDELAHGHPHGFGFDDEDDFDEDDDDYDEDEFDEEK